MTGNPKYLSQGVVSRLLSRLEEQAGAELRLLVRLPLSTGMTTGELSHLRASWFEPEDGIVSVPRHQPCHCTQCTRQAVVADDDLDIEPEDVDTVADDERPLGYWNPATDLRVRRVELIDTATQDLLEEYLDHRDGMPHPATIDSRMDRLSDEVSLGEPITVSRLRHTCGLRLAAGGATVGQIVDHTGVTPQEAARYQEDAEGAEMGRALPMGDSIRDLRASHQH